MSLPELNSIISQNNIVETTVQEGAILHTVENSGNTVETTAISPAPIYTTHNTAPIVKTIITKDIQDITSVVNGFWDVVWSVNGQNGDVTVNPIIGDFTANTTYVKHSSIVNSGKLYRAINTFTSGQSFNPNNWEEIVINHNYTLPDFIANHQYGRNDIIFHNSELYVSATQFTSGENFNQENWIKIG